MDFTPHQLELLERVNREFYTAFDTINKVSDRKKITVFGSARMAETDPVFKEIEQFSNQLRSEGWMMISGGGPGVMRAALSKEMTPDLETIAFGIDINTEHGQTQADVSTQFTDFFVRKYFLRIADVFIIAPGGFGTLDEVCEVLTLIQTSKIKFRKVIFYKKEYWGPFLDWFENTLLPHGMIAKDDLSLYTVADTPEEVVNQVNHAR